MKVEGLLDTFTRLENPNFAGVAASVGFKAWRAERNEDLEEAVTTFLAHPGPALLDVKVNRMELVVPPKAEVGQVLGTALYSTKAVLGGRSGDVLQLLESNFLS
jgi:pyruvate dehydrogenase (quinone)